MGVIAAGAASLGSTIMGGLSSAGGAISAAGGSAMKWLGGSTVGGLSNAGLLGVGTSILSTLAGGVSAKNQAKAMEKAQEAEWQARLQDTREAYKQIATQSQQMNQEANEDLMQNEVSLAQQKADVELMAAASGTGGQSVTSMMTDLSATAGRNSSTIIQNMENQQQSISNQLRAVQKGGAVEKRKFEKPSALGTIIKSVGSGAMGYLSGESTGKGLSKAYADSRRGTQPKVK